jgi:Protein ENHANCED DISEASE RESISTANCE 2, C-terminal
MRLPCTSTSTLRDARLKLLPVVVDGPWIVRAAVPGTSPALLGKVIPLQYYSTHKENGRSIFEVDVIITASSIAKGILSVVKGHAKALSIALAFIIEAAEEHELPETVLASFQINSLHLEDCPLLPDCNLDAF